MNEQDEIVKADARHDEAEDLLRRKRQRARSLALGLGLTALAVLFFLVTIVRLGSNVFNRAL